MQKIIKLVSWPVRKIFNYTKGVDKVLEAPNKIQEVWTESQILASKLFGTTTGAAGAAWGTVDALEAYACKDGVCFVVSCIGVTADGVHFIANFFPGVNITTPVAIPVSIFCKTFVKKCKSGATLPWKRFC